MLSKVLSAEKMLITDAVEILIVVDVGKDIEGCRFGAVIAMHMIVMRHHLEHFSATLQILCAAFGTSLTLIVLEARYR